MGMISFGSKRILSNQRKLPSEYDMLCWDTNGCRVFDYHEHNILAESKVGFLYHIILYKQKLSKKADPVFNELFTACLIDPLTYAESVAGQYLGFLGKVSDKSTEMFELILDEIQKKGSANEFVKAISDN